MKILFISRAYPPVIGGIEKQNFEISRALKALAETRIIANRKGKVMLPLFLPYALLRAIILVRRYDVVLLGDGVLAIIGRLLKLITKKPVVCIVHGLDLTYKNKLYQRFWVGHFLPGLDRLVAVGNETQRQGTKRKIPAGKFTFIPNGVSEPVPPVDYSRKNLETILGKRPPGPVLLTLGRLVKRKGVAWFIEHVFTRLGDDLTYIVAGTGPERDAISDLVNQLRLGGRVLILGEVSEREKEILLANADLFIQPNIPVENDMEGFGLVVLEAAAHECAVIAANLEGLKDAISHGNNGLLVPAGNAEAFESQIMSLLDNPGDIEQLGKHAARYVRAHYSWPSVAHRYLDLLAVEIGRPSPS